MHLHKQHDTLELIQQEHFVLAVFFLFDERGLQQLKVSQDIHPCHQENLKEDIKVWFKFLCNEKEKQENKYIL